MCCSSYGRNREHRLHYPYAQVGRQLLLARLTSPSTALASTCGYRRTRRNALDIRAILNPVAYGKYDSQTSPVSIRPLTDVQNHTIQFRNLNHK